MREPSKRGSLGALAGLCVISLSAGLGVPASAQDTARPQSTASATHPATPKARGLYYVDFRARTAASYGHAFVWYGRTDRRAVDRNTCQASMAPRQIST